MVYTAASRALALLEIAVHLDLSEDLPTDRFFVEIDIPDRLPFAHVPETSLSVRTPSSPENWHDSPPLPETQLLGDRFAAEAKAAILRVPSSILPAEFNYLINPLHPDAGHIKVVSTTALKPDGRFGLV